MENQYDYEEEKKLKEFAKETVEIADEYANARSVYAEAKLRMDGRLAEAYKLNRTDPKAGIKETLAIEKAYLQLTIDDPEAKADYDRVIKEEQSYKAIEAVLKARESYVSLNQSLIKIKQQAGVV